MDDRYNASTTRSGSRPSSGDGIGLLSSRDPPNVMATTITATEPGTFYRGRHSRGNSREERLGSIDESGGSYEMIEPPTPTKTRRLSPGPSNASSMLRRLTTKIAPVGRPHFRSTKRTKGQQYATLDDEDDNRASTVDISSLAGLGWELNDMSHLDVSHPGEDTAYNPPASTERKPDFRSFVEKRRSVGEGMRDIGVQLRRDPTKVVRRPTGGSGGGLSTGIDRAKTVRQLGQDLAQKKNMIVEIEEAVDLSSLEGGQPDNRASRAFETTSDRQSIMPQETKSYFFPEDPDIPNWKPFSMSSIYILVLMALALGLAGLQEYLCQRSIKRTKENSGLLAFNHVAEISTWDFFAWKYLPTMVCIVYAVLFSIMDFDIRRLEPFYQLSRPGGALASASLNLDHLTMFQYFVPFKAFRLKQYAVLFSTTGNIVASMVGPSLQNPSLDMQTNPNPKCNAGGCGDSDEKHYWLRVDPVWSRLLSASYLIVALVLVVLFFQLRRKSGLLSDPKGIAGIASMATKSHILQDFSGLDMATRGKIHKRLQHRRYVLYKSSIWQGEWTSTSDPVLDSEKKLTSPHPIMLRLEFGIPFLIFMLLCMVAVLLITLTPARVVPNAVPWLPIVVATALKLTFSTFEADVRLIEPFYQLSKGNAKPENSLTLDYQATVYGWITCKALWNRHYLVALVGFSSLLLDILTVTVGSFSVNSEVFLKLKDKDDSSGDETFASFWASLILSVTILVIVICTTSIVYWRRRHPFLPREPSTIAAILAFIYSSNMLTDFIDTETLNNKQMEQRLMGLGKRYGLGWFRGRDGQIHCAIDEEPMRSRYVHGKPYTMAQAGPLQPHETFYSV
ncbi:hypothetical protein PV08_11493 [Exophiala spinifera]|uniref:Uncharacterized protein n=1 Tax=Exophiala spinifera TaxID=91928 RepID=A0A0D2BGU0_9EURO|nr:uncharacterized protein PV08_11493 [Exophiala spinifera]KIW10529.1 hypothetical protein PV08_11493 [Exophiala spinifera]